MSAETVALIGPPEEEMQVGGVVAAVDLLLRHGRRPQPVTAETGFVTRETLPACVHACVRVVPAVDCGTCIRLQGPAAAVGPGPLLGVPGQAHTDVHSETVTDLFAHMRVPGGFCKLGVQQGDITNPCSCTSIS